MRIVGMILVLLGMTVGIVEFRAMTNPVIAQDIATKFAEHTRWRHSAGSGGSSSRHGD